MAFKFVVLAALVAVAHCSLLPVVPVDTDSTSFAYDVADPNTGDYKSQVETRVGGNVVGQYSLREPDGSRRTVDYTANDVNGFNAIVRNDPAVVAVPVIGTSAVSSTPVIGVQPSIVSARAFGSNVFYGVNSYPSLYNSVIPPSPYSAFARSIYPGSVSFAGPLTYYAK